LQEAFFLVAGVCLAMAGMNILLTAISVGMVKFILVNSGLAVGHRMQNERLQSLAPLRFLNTCKSW
jgi:putative Mn2+ efflux pump MntP